MREAARMVGLAFFIAGSFCLVRHLYEPGDRMIDMVFLVIGVAFSMVPLSI